MYLKREIYKLIFPEDVDVINVDNPVDARPVRTLVREEETRTIRYPKVLMLEISYTGNVWIKTTYGHRGAIQARTYTDDIDYLARQADVIIIEHLNEHNQVGFVDIVTWHELRRYVTGGEGNEPGTVRHLSPGESQMPS